METRTTENRNALRDTHAGAGSPSTDETSDATCKLELSQHRDQ